MRSSIMSGLFGVFCSVLILSALEFTPSESSPHRQTRETSDLGQELKERFTNMGTTISESEMFAKFSELTKEFTTKVQETLEEFLKPRNRREVSSGTPLELASSHRVVRQIPGMDQAISMMSNAGESIVKTGTDVISKAPEVGANFVQKTQEMGSQIMQSFGRRRRSPKGSNQRTA